MHNMDLELSSSGAVAMQSEIHAAGTSVSSLLL
jgi:hypothetical protein